MIELGSRRRSQPAPPRVLWEALTQPRRPGGREWLYLERGEVDPVVMEAQEHHLVVWSSIWLDRPRDRIVFDIAPAGYGSDLRWTLLTEESHPPPAEVVRQLRHRLNRLINADLRYSFGQ
jgi:hypothetical protein